METGNPPRSPWRNFPDVLIHAQESAVKKHADYRAAKSGEIASARRVVEATLNDNMVKALGSLASSSNPVLASVHAYEAEGINRIPAVFAEVLAERLGLRAEAGIVQSNRTGHTGATAIGCTTLTGKPWSAKLTPSADTLQTLRDKHGGELESWWKDTFGYSFDFLTESEARYLARADSVELIRNRILAARQARDD